MAKQRHYHHHCGRSDPQPLLYWPNRAPANSVLPKYSHFTFYLHLGQTEPIPPPSWLHQYLVTNILTKQSSCHLYLVQRDPLLSNFPNQRSFHLLNKASDTSVLIKQRTWYLCLDETYPKSPLPWLCYICLSQIELLSPSPYRSRCHICKTNTLSKQSPATSHLGEEEHMPPRPWSNKASHNKQLDQTEPFSPLLS